MNALFHKQPCVIFTKPQSLAYVYTGNSSLMIPLSGIASQRIDLVVRTEE